MRVKKKLIQTYFVASRYIHICPIYAADIPMDGVMFFPLFPFLLLEMARFSWASRAYIFSITMKNCYPSKDFILCIPPKLWFYLYSYKGLSLLDFGVCFLSLFFSH